MGEMPIINDNNYQNFLKGSRGYWGMFRTPLGRARCKTFADLGIPLIPEKDWDDIIRQQQKDKATIKDLCLEMGLPCKDQGSTNYCWGNAPTFCSEFNRLTETGQVVSYSPASVCAPIKGFRNYGGWGEEWLNFARENGCNIIAGIRPPLDM